jgi:hypothetical protein
VGATFDDVLLTVRRDGDALVVRIVDSPAGTTAELTSTVAHLDRWTTAAGGPDASMVRDVGIADPAGEDGAIVGAALFVATFRDEVGDRLRATQERAATIGTTLRLVLRLDPACDGLPWELLRDPESARFLALEHPIVRTVEGAADARPPITGVLRILVAVAVPPDAAPLDAVAEVEGLRARLRRFVDAGAVEVHVVASASLGALARALEDGPWHVVHYVGHGTVAPDGRGAVLLHGDGDGSDLVAGADVGAVLAAAGDVRLVVLNSCRGASGDGHDPFAATAAAIARAGVPTVIAMRRAVTDRAAIDLADALYAALVAGASVEAAVTSARRVLHGTRRTNAEWATPALYCRAGRAATTIVAPADSDVRFTVARPAALRADRWETMLVLAHRGGPYVGDRGETVDPHQQVAARIQSLFTDTTPQTTSVTSAAGIPRGTDLLVEADVPGVERAVFGSPATWRGDLAEVLVQLRAPVSLLGATVDGWVRVFSGPLLLAEAAVRFVVVGADAPDASAAPQPMRPFRRIFPCFSPDDIALVTAVAAYAEASGDEYVRGVLRHDPSAPDDWMVPAIADADVFQLFWSTSSMRSERCRRQWEAALATGRNDFVRPLYWERPMPQTSDLPPPALRAVQFVAVPAPVLAPPMDAGAPVAAPRPAPPVDEPPRQEGPAFEVGARPVPPGSGRPVSPTGPGDRVPPPRHDKGAGPRAVLAAAAVTLGCLVGLVVGFQATTSRHADGPPPTTATGVSGPSPTTVPAGAGTGSDVAWLPGLLIGLAVGLLVAVVILRWRRR